MLKFVAVIEISISDFMREKFVCYDRYSHLQLKEIFAIIFKLLFYVKGHVSYVMRRVMRMEI